MLCLHLGYLAGILREGGYRALRMRRARKVGDGGSGLWLPDVSGC